MCGPFKYILSDVSACRAAPHADALTFAELLAMGPPKDLLGRKLYYLSQARDFCWPLSSLSLPWTTQAREVLERDRQRQGEGMGGRGI